jgi:uncharacterized membrane protein
MGSIFQALGIDGAWLAKAAFEGNLLLLFLICFVHSWRTHGRSRTLREFSAGFMLTALCESTGVLSGAYVYPGFQLYIFATPIGNPASWVALVYVIMMLTDRIVFGLDALEVAPSVSTPEQGELKRAGRLLIRKSIPLTICILALVDATLALMLDLVLDPLATIYNWWIWVPDAPDVHTISAGVVDPYNFEHHVWMTTPENPIADFFAPFFEGGHRYPTRVLGIPLINFIAWLVFVFIFAAQFRWIEHERGWSEMKKTLTLWGLVLIDVPILGFLLIAPNL